MNPLKILSDRLQPAVERNDRGAIASALSELVRLEAHMGEQWHALAQLALRNGEILLARKAIDLFVDAQGGSARASYLKASVLEQCGDMAAADAVLRSLPDSVPDPAANAYSRGTAALFLGNKDEAISQLERATAMQPLAGHAWLSLSMAVDLAAREDTADRILAASAQAPAMPPPQRAAFFHAKGRVHEVREEHGEAFAAFAQGNALMRALAPYNAANETRMAQQSLEGFDAEAIAEFNAQAGDTGERTIFVTGTARSGTTLVEQIITSHSAVSHGGEIGRLPLLALEMRGHSAAALRKHAGANGSASLSRLWHRLIDERFPGATRVVDKSLNTTGYLGIAASLLPDAPLIWLKRDPLDVAWSAFRTFLPAGQQWSCDLSSIAHHMRQEEALLAHWQGVLGERLLVVPYEELVRDPRHWTARILGHCNLAEETAPYAPHENVRAVGTASVMQVRRPISSKAVGSAAPYRPYLGEFIEAWQA